MKTHWSFPVSSSVVILRVAISCAALAPALQAEAVREESFTLTAGWNLIHLSGEPLEKDPRLALVAVGWESLWTWVPSALLPAPGGAEGRWVGIRRESPTFLDSLQSLSGPASYALRASGAGSLRIRTAWRPNRSALAGARSQLFGPALPAGAPPSLAAYLSRPGVKEAVGAVYEFTGGAYRRVNDADPLRAGAAYWVRPAQDVPAPDPVRIGAGFGGLRFDAQNTLQVIEVDLGESAAGRQIRLQARPSLDGRSATDWIEFQTGEGGFAPLGSGTTLPVPADQTKLRIGLRAQQGGVAAPGAEFQSALLEIDAAAGRAEVGAELESATLKGLWIGEATLSEVEQSSRFGGGFAPAPSAPISLLLEVPPIGRPRLIPCVQIQGDRDGRKITFRAEAALFPEAVDLQGTLGASGTSGDLSGVAVLAPGHPLNPYRHRYHPEHGLGFQLTRSIGLRFESPGAGAPESPLATVGVLSGTYQEELTGLAPEPIRVRGDFRLRRLTGGTAQPCNAGG
jgi:hypothetical protein